MCAEGACNRAAEPSVAFCGEEGQGGCVKVIPQKAGSDSEASARALATEQPSRAWLFAGRSGSPKGEAVTFAKGKVEAYKKKNLHHQLKRVVQTLPKKVGSEPKPS